MEDLKHPEQAVISDPYHTFRVLDPRPSETETDPPAISQDNTSSCQDRDTLMRECEELPGNSMTCDPSSRLVLGGLQKLSCTEDVIMFINAGTETAREADPGMKFLADTHYDGGAPLRTNETIAEGGEYSFLYQSARVGDISYKLGDLAPGDYFVDLHFAEIININGPIGMRVFDVFLQDEKVLSEFDVYATAGANEAVQLVDSRVSVKEDGLINVRFVGVSGSPLISGICIRTAPKLSESSSMNEYVRCQSCTAEVEVPRTLVRDIQQKKTARYEKEIEDLNAKFIRKMEECSQAWMSLAAANDQLKTTRTELDNKLFQTYRLDQTVENQAAQLKTLSNKYGDDKRVWISSICDLEKRIKTIKQEQRQLSLEAHECAGSIPELNQMIFAVQALVSECEDLKAKYLEEQRMRKKLYNQVQDAKGNIRVFCRCRPLTMQEKAAGYATVADFEGAKDGDLVIRTGGSNKKTFKFDRVYTPEDDQVDVFADASPMVISVLDGYNVCIFAYGQTGTGKTFTMEGTVQNRGVNYRTLEQLFKIAQERRDTFTYKISVCVLEIYNEQIRDLLATSPAAKKLEIKQGSEGSHHVPGRVEAEVENIEQVWSVLQAGSNARAVGSNNVNEHSSRSHCMLCIMVRAKNLINGESTKSKLWLVDLAGSERLAKTDAQGERLKEAQNINKSLSALGDVVSALANKSTHIPYRNSKLTHLLQDSLGGDSKTLMFVQISPSEQDQSETLSSLNFASRVRGIELGLAKRQVDTSELQKTKTLLDKAKMEAKSKDESIKKLEESLQNLENKVRGRDQNYKSQQDKIGELEDQLYVKTTSLAQLEMQIVQLQERLKGKEEACNSLQQKVKELETNLREHEHSDSAALEQVREMERKLKEQIQESESTSLALQTKIKELEQKVKEQDRNHDSSLLHEKVKELEKKVREQEQQLQHTNNLPMTLAHDIPIGTTPIGARPSLKDEIMSEVEPFVLRSSNSVKSNQMSNSSTTLFKGSKETTTRRKREFRSGEMENHAPISSAPSQQDKKIRKSDPPRPFPRTTRTVTKPTVGGAVVPPQRRFSHSKISRNEGQASKDKDAKKRIWC